MPGPSPRRSGFGRAGGTSPAMTSGDDLRQTTSWGYGSWRSAGTMAEDALPARLLKRHLREAPQLARMQSLRLLMLQPLQRLQPDLEMLPDALAVELACHSGELDLAVQRLVGDAEQGAVGHAEAIAVGGDRRRLHVECDRARL